MARGEKKKGKTSESEQRKVAIADFHKMLILAQWALRIFDGASFDPIKEALKFPRLEGINQETGHTWFYHTLVDQNLFYLGNDAKCTKEQLAAYDSRIVGYWNQITEKRNAQEQTIYRMKYYQYLSLLVTELYLDWYFNRRIELLAELNAAVDAYNANHLKDPLPALEKEDLNKICFWEATGAGKTLLMDINILQYRFYAPEKAEHTILLTPDEGLTRQHLKELALSGFSAEEIKESNLLFMCDKTTVGVIDAGKIISDASSRKKGEKSFLAEEFEGKNLVLVDEGHNGSGKEDGERRRVRMQLCQDGFSFEYSATFGQAVAKSNNKELRNHYARNILFDYSYKYFYEDGYGKNAYILNMEDVDNDDRVFEYLCASLLKFTQQHVIFKHEPETMVAFNIEKPLCMFVGHTVVKKTKSQTLSDSEKEELSDVATVVNFFARVLNERERVENLFQRFLQNESILVDAKGRNLLEQAFVPIFKWCSDGKACYEQMLSLVMNTSLAQRLKVSHLKGGVNEVILSVGTSEPFAVINIGDCATLTSQLSESSQFDVEPANDFSESLFDKVNEKDSCINVIIGSRKFTQGWSCWRVSAMGLLNMGISEGAQIIQLFGRGVRLKGRNYSLKRSKPEERPKESFLDRLETLNVFGLRATYMARFKEYLNEEGVTTEDAVITLKFPIQKRFNLPQLSIVDTAEGYKLHQRLGYKTQKAILFEIPEEIRKKVKLPHVKYEDYAHLQMIQKGTTVKLSDTDAKQEVKIDKKAFLFFDWDGIYRRLMEAKAQKGYWNLKLEKRRLIDFAQGDSSWYTLYSRAADVTFDSFEKLKKLQDLFEVLLYNYMEKFYKTLQHLYESGHQTRKFLDASTFPTEYEFQLKDDDVGNAWMVRLKELQGLIANRDIPAIKNKWSNGDLIALLFDYHLYEPLFYVEKGKHLPFRLRPISFDSSSELQFMRDLEAFYKDEKNAHYFENVDLYLLRNPANKSQGVGFAQAGNFYPDFLLWLVDKTTNRQSLTFIDPKGIRNIPLEDAKFNFAKECKQLEAQINQGNDTPVILNSFILSDTPWTDPIVQQHSKEEWHAKHVFFLEDGAENYLSQIFTIIRKSE